MFIGGFVVFFVSFLVYFRYLLQTVQKYWTQPNSWQVMDDKFLPASRVFPVQSIITSKQQFMQAYIKPNWMHWMHHSQHPKCLTFLFMVIAGTSNTLDALDAPKCSHMLENGQKWSKVIHNALKCSKMLQNVSKCFGLLPNIPRIVQNFSELSKML